MTDNCKRKSFPHSSDTPRTQACESELSKNSILQCIRWHNLLIAKAPPSRLTRTGFSLVEVVIVVLIIGILSAVAVPKYIDHIRKTKDRSHRIKLMTLRDAIERYVIEHDRSLPPATSEEVFKNAILEYLPAAFPAVELHIDEPHENFDRTGVEIVDSQLLMNGQSKPSQAWKYNSATGHMIINLHIPTALDPQSHYDQW